jgi:galactitol-specific phosphotransferase system IIB component
MRGSSSSIDHRVHHRMARVCATGLNTSHVLNSCVYWIILSTYLGSPSSMKLALCSQSAAVILGITIIVCVANTPICKIPHAPSAIQT